MNIFFRQTYTRKFRTWKALILGASSLLPTVKTEPGLNASALGTQSLPSLGTSTATTNAASLQTVTSQTTTAASTPTTSQLARMMTSSPSQPKTLLTSATPGYIFWFLRFKITV